MPKISDPISPELKPKPGEVKRPLPSRVERFLGRVVFACSILFFCWVFVAYVILPAIWRHYEHHPAMENAPRTTLTSLGIVGDPLNVGIFGSQEDLIRSMLAAGWRPADPVTLRSSVHIAESVLLSRAYVDAPVSDLFVFGRKQDLAFEKPAGGNARHRNHVRFWKSTELGRGTMPLWIGAATFDRSVGFSHRTGQITHHIGPDIDAERNLLIDDLVRAKRVAQLFQVTGVGATVAGHNGGGDWYYTDGELTLGVLAAADSADRQGEPKTLENPTAVQIKEQFWDALRPLLQSLSTASQESGTGDA